MEMNGEEKHPYLNRRRRSVIRDFFRLTSIHGLPAISRAYAPRHLFCWSLIFFLFVLVMLYFIITVILAYFTYPTQTNVDIVVEYPMLFPAVTVCNYAILRYDLLIGPFINYTNRLGLTSSNTSAAPDFSDPNVLLSIYQFLNDVVDNNGSVFDYAFDLKELLFSCKYNGLSCNASDFAKVNFVYLFSIFSCFLLFQSSSHPQSTGSAIRLMRKLVMTIHQFVRRLPMVGRVYWNWNFLSMII
jgi:hypothetical protein